MSDVDSNASSAGSILEAPSDSESSTFKCLFCDSEWQDVAEMFGHVEKEHRFPITRTIKEVGSKDELAVIKLVNYLRKECEKGTDASGLKVKSEDLEHDALLMPTLLDDPLLHELGDFMPDFDEEHKPIDYEEFEAKRGVTEGLEKLDLDSDRDERYFESYKGSGIHREMIEDRVRTEGYRDAVEKHADLFKGKTVLDVGCGSGILSLFCARAGAAKVFAVDNSDIAKKAKENIAKNGYENKITVIQGRIEDFNTERQIGKDKVDIIISEWMGYGLLFEGMLDSVLRARDLYLKPDGLLFPSYCTMLVAPIADRQWVAESNGEKFWKDVYGFDFSAMNSNNINEKEVAILGVPSKALCGSPSVFYTIDIPKVAVKDLDFTSSFSTTIDRDVESLDAFAIWFDTFFLPPGPAPDLSAADALKWGKNGEKGLAFSTGPFGTATHWHQAVLLLKKEECGGSLKAGTTIDGTVRYNKQKRDVRGIDVDITWKDGVGVTWKVSRTI
ncbi:S-adenosyl-L-methionine-dependent methyltransferase, partial [Amniculicola lignicola CBS 123094]